MHDVINLVFNIPRQKRRLTEFYSKIPRPKSSFYFIGKLRRAPSQSGGGRGSAIGSDTGCANTNVIHSASNIFSLSLCTFLHYHLLKKVFYFHDDLFESALTLARAISSRRNKANSENTPKKEKKIHLKLLPFAWKPARTLI